jgi:hypothetical protein
MKLDELRFPSSSRALQGRVKLVRRVPDGQIRTEIAEACSKAPDERSEPLD